MVDTLVNDSPYMVIGQGIEYCFALTSALYEGTLFQYSQLVRNCTLSHFECIGNLANAKLLFKQSTKNAYSGRVAKKFKKFGKLIHFFFGRHSFGHG